MNKISRRLCCYTKCVSPKRIDWQTLGIDGERIKTAIEKRAIIVIEVVCTEKDVTLSVYDLVMSMKAHQTDYTACTCRCSYWMAFEQCGQLLIALESRLWNFIAYSLNLHLCLSPNFSLPRNATALPVHPKLLHALYYAKRPAYFVLRMLRDMVRPALDINKLRHRLAKRRYRLNTEKLVKTLNLMTDNIYQLYEEVVDRESHKRRKLLLKQEQRERYDKDADYDVQNYEQQDSYTEYKGLYSDDYVECLVQPKTDAQGRPLPEFLRLLDMFTSYLCQLVNECEFSVTAFVQELKHPYRRANRCIMNELPIDEAPFSCLRASIRSLFDNRRDTIIHSTVLVKVINIAKEIKQDDCLAYVGRFHFKTFGECTKNARGNVKKPHVSKKCPTTVIRGQQVEMLQRTLERLSLPKLYWFMCADIEHEYGMLHSNKESADNFEYDYSGTLRELTYWPTKNQYQSSCVCMYSGKNMSSYLNEHYNNSNHSYYANDYVGLQTFLHALDVIRFGSLQPLLLSIHDIVFKLGGQAFDAAIAIDLDTKEALYTRDFFAVFHYTTYDRAFIAACEKIMIAQKHNFIYNIY